MSPESEPRLALLRLLRQEALSLQEVRLTSGKVSNYYIDCRRVTLSAPGAYWTAQLLLPQLAAAGVVALGGLTLGADPIVAAVAALSFTTSTPLQAFIVRKEAKKHGRQRSIEGPDLPAGARVAIIDDVATTGRSLLQAIQVVQAETTWQIAQVLCLVDRQEGAGELLAQAGFALQSCYTAAELLGSP